MQRREFMILTAALSLSGLMPKFAMADDYPKNKPVLIVVPFAPGAGNDILGRLTAEHLTKRIGQQVVVENRIGAGSQIGIDSVAKAAPDGYSLIWAASDGISILPAVRANMPYKVPDDFEFVSRIVVLPFAIGVNPSLPIHNMAELVEYAKNNKVRYGTSGVGGAPHMGCVMLQNATGIQMTHVPYSGVSASVTDLLGGHIEMAYITPPTAKPHADSGKIRIIATTGTERHPLFPDVPTLEEAGIKNSNVIVWYGVLAPKGTPAPVLTMLRSQISDILKDPEVTARLTKLGYQPSYIEGDAFRDYVMADLEKWKGVARSAGIKLED